MNILVHTCIIGTTGYANHARSFFTHLNKYQNVKVRNFTIGSKWGGIDGSVHDNEPYMTDELKGMLYQQTLFNSDGSRSDFKLSGYDENFKPDVHIVLNDMNHYYFYDNYEGYKIAYNVWETTRYPDDFFNQLLKFDEVWVPTQWQFDCLVEQGYPKEKISIVTEGVDIQTFTPIKKIPKRKKFKFLLFGRWEYRKGTTEIIRAFGEEFKGMDDIELIASVENPYPYDGLKTTKERVDFNNIKYPNIRYIDFPTRNEYVKYLQEGNVFVSCARSEGWNLPLCVPKNKLIFANDKFIPIEDVKVNDLVISHSGNERKVINLMKRKHEDEIVNIDLYCDFEKLSLTPEHPIYAIKRNEFIAKKDKFKNIDKISPKWVEAKNIEVGDIVIRTTIKQKYFNDEKIDLLSFDETLKYDDNFIWYNTGYNNKKELIKINRYVNLWDLSFLFGWYIAEGTDGKNKLILTLNANKEVFIAEKIVADIKNIFGINGKIRIKNNTLIVCINSKLLCKFFTTYCDKMSFNKKIPEKILLGPINQLQKMVDNMVLGDGHFGKNSVSYTTVSHILARQLVFANQRLGVKSRIQLAKRKRKNKRPCYTISWSENNENNRHGNKVWSHPDGFAILVKNVEKTHYNDYVYNIEVEEDNSYLLSNAVVHNCEAMACGTPSIYSDWGGQLEFASGKGIPVKIEGLIPANFEHKDFPGEFCEPSWEDLRKQLRNSYENYKENRVLALVDAKSIHENFNWDKVAKDASDMLEKKLDKTFAFVTTGNIGYMPVIEKLVQSLLTFSSAKILVYGIDCDVPFDYPNVIKRRIDPPKYSEHDKWYWKQYACIEAFNETEYNNFVWMDGDVVVNYNIDTIEKHFKDIENYPLSDIHRQEEFYGYYQYNGETRNQSFNEQLAIEWGVQKKLPYLHVCMFVYNRACVGWFEQVIEAYKSIDLKDYKRLFLWNDEGIENALRWKYGYTKHLPLSNFDTSSYDGDAGQTQKQLDDFYTFWNEKGPYNFDRVYGYQYIPRNKEDVLYFHGNKNADFSDKMVEFIKLKIGDNFFNSEYFYTGIYKVENLGDIKGYEGGTLEVAEKFGWFRAIYHEIFNLLDYNKNRERSIFDGDVVVDLGGNIGIFNRWAYSQGASKVISFEPDKRYFKLLSLNANPKSILFNAAAAHEMGELNLYESDHLGGSNIFGNPSAKGYSVKTYTLNYLFETGLIDKIDFLKVDIEGAEHAAFQGISDENLMKVRTISMEYHHSFFDFNEDLRTQFIQRLTKLGFNSYLLFMGTNNALQMLYFTR